MAADSLKPGLASEAVLVVDEMRTAVHLGSGTMRVLATPAMVLFIEEVCRMMVEPYLGQGKSTVGVSVQVRHLAPTPVGQTIHCRAEVVKVEEGLITFRADVWDPTEKVGEGEHKRAIIDVDRFMHRVQAKIDAAKAAPG